MKLLFTRLLQFCFLSLLVVVFHGLAASADVNSVKGQWQYLIRRGDSKGVGGSFSNPNCPLYIGYLSFDFRPFQANNRGQMTLASNDLYVMSRQGTGKMYAIGRQSYEVKGSYTPVDDDSLCSNPVTQAQDEKALIKMTKISNDGRDLEWYTDFQQGSNGGNAVWKYKASFDGSNKITGILKAYTCEGSGMDRSCALLNTAKFEASRINSIEEASRKPLFNKKDSLTTFFQRLFHFTTISHDGQSMYSGEENLFQQLPLDYVKPSLQAMFPASAASNIGTTICKQRGGFGSNPCKVCKNVGNCAGGQNPVEERVCCFGNHDGKSLCKTDCVDLKKCRTGGNQSACV